MQTPNCKQDGNRIFDPPIFLPHVWLRVGVRLRVSISNRGIKCRTLIKALLISVRVRDYLADSDPVWLTVIQMIVSIVS